MAQIKTVALFKSTKVGALGTAGTILSDRINLADMGEAPETFSLSYGIASTNGGGAGTAGSSTFQYLCAPTEDGTYIVLGTFGTQGNGPAQSGFCSFSPTLAPFMKIQAVSGTSAPALVTAELHMR